MWRRATPPYPLAYLPSIPERVPVYKRRKVLILLVAVGGVFRLLENAVSGALTDKARIVRVPMV